VTEAEKHLAAIKDLDLSKPADMPLHEWDRRSTPPVLTDDPFAFGSKLYSAALAAADLRVFQETLTRILEIAELATIYRDPNGSRPDYPLSAMILQHAEDQLDYTAALVRESDKTGSIVLKYQELSGDFIRKASARSQQCGELHRHLAYLMLDLAKHSLTGERRAAALLALVVCREAAQKGLDLPDKDDLIFYSRLGAYVEVFKELGIRAIQLRNAEFLYRCLDAACWLGCSAVKKGNDEIAIACLQTLVQLGRHAQRATLECFWDRCAHTEGTCRRASLLDDELGA